jgi:protoheme IX farnesyltransferase
MRPVKPVETLTAMLFATTETAKMRSPLLDSKVFQLRRKWLSIASDLFRVRLNALVLLTTAAGFYLGSSGPVDWHRMFQMLVGTALLAGAVSALNQWWERESDVHMRRTAGRPLPAARILPQTVLWVGIIGTWLGFLTLASTVNAMTTVLGSVATVIYLFVYTPLKRRTWLNTMVGAISGALPVLMGWTASRGRLDAVGWILFGILALWQMPHFLAISWIYRDDYANAGFSMLSRWDPQGRSSGRQALGFTVGLCCCSLGLVALDLCGWIYFWGATFLGLWLLKNALKFQAEPTTSRASQLFRASIWYLSLLLLFMLVDKIH